MQNAKLNKMQNPFSVLESSAQLLDHNGLPLGKVSGDNMLASLAHQPQVEARIVQRSNLRCQHLSTHHKVMQVGLRVLMIYEGRSIRVNRREVVLPLLVADIDNTLAREKSLRRNQDREEPLGSIRR